MYFWPAQLNPLVELDGTSLLIGGLILIGLILLFGSLLLARSIRRRNAASAAAELVAEEASEEAQLSEEAPAEVLPDASDSDVLVSGAPDADDRISGLEIAEVILPASGAETTEDTAYEPAEEPGLMPETVVEQAMLPTPLLPDELEARSYLEQVNKYVLMHRGRIREEPGILELSWQTRNGSRSVHIAATADEQELMINGIPFEASSEGVKKGIVASLKSPDNR